MFFSEPSLHQGLEITLTGETAGWKSRSYVRVPYHAAHTLYLAYTKGYKVAICDQIEDPATAKGIVKGCDQGNNTGTVIDLPCWKKENNI